MSVVFGVIVAVLLLIIGIFVYRQTGDKRSASLDDGAPMPAAFRRTLAGYLVLLGVVLVYLLVALYSVDVPEVALLPIAVPPIPVITGQKSPPPPAPANQANAQPSSTPAASQQSNQVQPVPVITKVFPETTQGATPRISLSIYGSGFEQGSKVLLNQAPPLRPINFFDEQLVSVALESADLAGVGAVIVSVTNAQGKPSNSLAVPIGRPTGMLNVFGMDLPVTKETQLLLLAIFAGMLGSYVHALQSFVDFVGNRTLMTSWFWWYVTRPFLGMAMSLIFYAVIRGGFLAGTPADAKVVNPFGVVAVGTLVGMFTDKATTKLSEVFDTLFKADDKRSGKLTTPIIDKLEPDTVPPGGAPPVITVRGDHLAQASVIRINGEERKPDSVAEKELRLKLRPEDVAKVATLKIIVITTDGTTSTSATLHVSDLAISSAQVSNATAGADYTETIAATGGSQPYKWSLADGPDWLKLDESSGTLKGKPAGKGSVKLTVKVADASGASASRSFNLEIA